MKLLQTHLYLPVFQSGIRQQHCVLRSNFRPELNVSISCSSSSSSSSNSNCRIPHTLPYKQQQQHSQQQRMQRPSSNKGIPAREATAAKCSNRSKGQQQLTSSCSSIHESISAISHQQQLLAAMAAKNSSSSSSSSSSRFLPLGCPVNLSTMIVILFIGPQPLKCS